MPGDPAALRATLRRLTGFSAPARVRLAARERLDPQGAAIIERLDLLRLDGVGTETAPLRGFLCRPAGQGPFPALLYCHAHGNAYEIGADELIRGRPALLDPPYGLALTAAGFASLAIDMPCFGARRGESESAAAKRHLWQGGTLFGAMLADLAGALDLLAGLPGIDPGRIGTLGLSMGATHAFWLGALEPRVRAVVQLCVLADLASLIETGAHDLHGPYMTVPGLLAHATTGGIAGLVAPRPHFVGLGALDPLTPEAARERALAELRAAYAGNDEALTILVEPATAHRETEAIRRETFRFLARHLGSSA